MVKRNNTYGDWTNYETWCVAHQFENDPHSDTDMENICMDGGSLDEMFIDYFKSRVHELTPVKPILVESDEWSDILNNRLHLVNWAEIADFFLDYYKRFLHLRYDPEILFH